MTELVTDRLLLRAPRADDAPCYALGVGEYAVARWLTPLPWPYTLTMAADWLRQAPPPAPGKALFIVDHPQKGLIGGVSLLGELGFWIARPHWGRGYGLEAARAVIDWHFAQSEDDAILSSAHHDNHASLQLKARLGFRPVGREFRFSQALQHNVEHIVTRLDRTNWANGEKSRCA
ncbi:MAG: GNAT family N-acetyltransferase [Devosia sp.]|nr:GNAT family N-acetyltransferase [Devosia sp.]